MSVTGWTWAELRETPAPVVKRMRLYLVVQQVKQHGGELRFE